MNASPTASRLRLGLAILLVLALVSLSVLFRDWVRQAIVLPIAYLVWLVGLVLRSIDQAVFWILLGLIIVLVLLISLLGSLFGGEAAVPVEGETPWGGRARYWARQVSVSQRNVLFQSDMKAALWRLAVLSLAHQNRLTPPEADAALRSGQIPAPERVLAYLRSAEAGLEQRGPGLLERLKDRFHLQRETRPVDPDLIAAIQYLEEQLEVPHEPQSR